MKGKGPAEASPEFLADEQQNHESRDDEPQSGSLIPQPGQLFCLGIDQLTRGINDLLFAGSSGDLHLSRVEGTAKPLGLTSANIATSPDQAQCCYKDLHYGL